MEACSSEHKIGPRQDRRSSDEGEKLPAKVKSRPEAKSKKRKGRYKILLTSRSHMSARDCLFLDVGRLETWVVSLPSPLEPPIPAISQVLNTSSTDNLDYRDFPARPRSKTAQKQKRPISKTPCKYNVLYKPPYKHSAP